MARFSVGDIFSRKQGSILFIITSVGNSEYYYKFLNFKESDQEYPIDLFEHHEGKSHIYMGKARIHKISRFYK